MCGAELVCSAENGAWRLPASFEGAKQLLWTRPGGLQPPASIQGVCALQKKAHCWVPCSFRVRWNGSSVRSMCEQISIKKILRQFYCACILVCPKNRRLKCKGTLLLDMFIRTLLSVFFFCFDFLLTAFFVHVKSVVYFFIAMLCIVLVSLSGMRNEQPLLRFSFRRNG